MNSTMQQDEQKRNKVLTDTGYEKLSILFENDANLALVWLRIEIEKRLRSILPENQSRISTKNLLYELKEKDIIQHRLYCAILDLLPSLNKAAHGGTVSDGAIDVIKRVAENVLSLLDDVVASHSSSANRN